jgi:hypothetical protein
VKRLLFGPRRSTPLELVGAAPVLVGGTTGDIRGVEPVLPWVSDNEPRTVVCGLADEASAGTVLGGKDGGGMGVELAVFPESGLWFFLVSFRFPFTRAGFSASCSVPNGGPYD